ncbi:MAG: glycosyltransferase family 2 protein [Bryobacteraceae bacterium]
MNLSVVVLTFNEEANLARCLASMVNLGAPLFVVDSGSTDNTRAIARSFGALVVEHPFRTHAEQWRWALDNVPLTTNWVLALDADQALTAELEDELRSLQPAAGVSGYFLNRRQVFRGRWIKHGAYYPKYLLKLFDRSKVCFDENDLVDHHFYVTGETRCLRNDLVEANSKEDDISFWIQKHDRYAALLAEEELRRRKCTAPSPVRARLFGNPDERSSLLKTWWRRMPPYVRPPLYFVYRYFIRFGWLDGRQGFVFHFMQAFWFRLMVDLKLEELLAADRAAESRPHPIQPARGAS